MKRTNQKTRKFNLYKLEQVILFSILLCFALSAYVLPSSKEKYMPEAPPSEDIVVSLEDEITLPDKTDDDTSDDISDDTSVDSEMSSDEEIEEVEETPDSSDNSDKSDKSDTSDSSSKKDTDKKEESDNE